MADRLPHCTARLVRTVGVLPADGSRRVVLYMHGGGFLTCGGASAYFDKVVTSRSCVLGTAQPVCAGARAP